MSHLLDVNVLLAAIWENHPQHAKAFGWLAGKRIIICPLTQLGSLKAINAPMDKARALLKQFAEDRNVECIPDDLDALRSHPKTSEMVTDHYLADLAASHGSKLATLDGNISHTAVEII